MASVTSRPRTPHPPSEPRPCWSYRRQATHRAGSRARTRITTAAARDFLALLTPMVTLANRLFQWLAHTGPADAVPAQDDDVLDATRVAVTTDAPCIVARG